MSILHKIDEINFTPNTCISIFHFIPRNCRKVRVHTCKPQRIEPFFFIFMYGLVYVRHTLINPESARRIRPEN